MSPELLEQLKARDYPVKISFDDQDKVYVAEFFDLPGCSAYGDTVQEAYHRAQEAKAEWLRVTLEQGLPIPEPSKTEEYSGRILVRLPTSLHSMLSDKAKLHGASLNQYILHLLSAALVGDEVSTQLDELRNKIEHLEWRIAQLTLAVEPPQWQLGQMSTVSTRIGANYNIMAPGTEFASPTVNVVAGTVTLGESFKQKVTDAVSPLLISAQSVHRSERHARAK